MSLARKKQSLSYLLKKIIGCDNFLIHDDLSIDIIKPKNIKLEDYHLGTKQLYRLLNNKSIIKNKINLIEANKLVIDVNDLLPLNVPKTLNVNSLAINNYVKPNSGFDVFPHLVNNECVLEFKFCEIFLLEKIQKDFSGSVCIGFSPAVHSLDLPCNITELAILEAFVCNIRAFENITRYQNMEHINLHYITGLSSRLSYTTFQPQTYLYNDTKIDFHGLVGLLCCKKLKKFTHSYENPLYDIIGKYFDTSNKEDYMMDCVLELIQKGYDNAAEI